MFVEFYLNAKIRFCSFYQTSVYCVPTEGQELFESQGYENDYDIQDSCPHVA